MHEKFVYVHFFFKLRPNWFPEIWKVAFDLQKFPHPWLRTWRNHHQKKDALFFALIFFLQKNKIL